ncbi:MAG TPA: hypothetical protein PKY82_18495 [Pyrinomonadaceae bacterium]|nr:hypothetical protein [Pyrinomonadaceae bacterium]
MKILNIKSFVLSLFFAIIVIFSSNAVFAQSNNSSVEIPFEFHIGNEIVSAGKYELRRISPNTFLLINDSVKILAQTPLMLDDKKSAAAEKLVFNRYGNEYFLRQIFTGSNSVGRGLYESKAEKITRLRELETAKKAKIQQVAVTIN